MSKKRKHKQKVKINKNGNCIQKSKIQMGDNNHFDNSFTDNSVNYITQIIKQKPNISDKQYNEPKTYRPHLKDREDDIVTGYGFIIKPSNFVEGGWVVINLVDEEGCYICNHVHLNMKEKFYNYSVLDYNSIFVKFTGKVKLYTRDNKSKDYEIQLTKPPIFSFDKIVRDDNQIDYNFINNGFDETKINNFIEEKASKTEFMDLIVRLKDEINELTSYEFGKNFVYSYIINTFLLNRATYDLYEGNIKGIVASNKSLVHIIYIMASVILRLRIATYLSIDELFELITYECNIFQNVSNYKISPEHELTKKFKQYCKNNLSINKENELNTAWDTMYNRCRNFGSNPNPLNLKEIEIISNAYYVLDKYVNKYMDIK